MGVGAASAKIDMLGIDALCDSVCDGQSLSEIARQLEVSIGSLLSWIAADSERSARVKESRAHAARVWDERALDGIIKAERPFELAKAREAAQHYRWRASKTAPREYGDKVAIGGAEDMPGVKLDGVSHESLMELRSVIQSLAATGGVSAGGTGGAGG